MPAHHGKSEHIHHVGHFIKFSSNVIYSLAAKNGELRGKFVLEVLMIRHVTGDIPKCAS